MSKQKVDVNIVPGSQSPDTVVDPDSRQYFPGSQGKHESADDNCGAVPYDPDGQGT